MATLFVNPGISVSMDNFGVSVLAYGAITQATPNSIVDSLGSNSYVQFLGSFLYDGFGNLAGGTVNTIIDVEYGATVYALSGLSTPALSVVNWALTGNETAAKTTIFAGADLLLGSNGSDKLRGYGGGDIIAGGAGNDTLEGGAGVDTIDGGLGYDTAIRSASYASSKMATYNGVTVVTDAVNGPDYMTSVEAVQFSDRTVVTTSAIAFDPLAYLASHMDLVAEVGINTAAAWQHYVQWGANGGWTTTFSPTAYMAANPDVAAAVGGNKDAATVNYILWGRLSGRPTGAPASSAMAAPDLDILSAPPSLANQVISLLG